MRSLGREALLEKMRIKVDKIYNRLNRAIHTIQIADATGATEPTSADFVFRVPTLGSGGTAKHSVINGPHVHSLIYGSFNNNAVRRGLTRYLNAELPSFRSKPIYTIHVEPIINGHRRGAHTAAAMPHETLCMGEETTHYL
jgi:hypothetical protein